MTYGHVLLFLLGLFCILAVLIDSFETVVLPRTVRRPVRIANFFFLLSRVAFKFAGKVAWKRLRQTLLFSFAPLTMIALMGLWAVLIVLGFSLMETGLDIPTSAASGASFLNRFYFSGTTFFTIGFGDFTPITAPGKLLAVLEGGMGLGFLALVISYLPVFYNAFSRREVTMLMLDSRAGSQPSAAELMRRHAEADCMEDLVGLLREWEIFSAQLLESYLSYPVLAFYRSQHDEQSWLKALSTIMDTCALTEILHLDKAAERGRLVSRGWDKRLRFQAKATFAMARHLVVDLSYVLNCEPVTGTDRLDKADLKRIAQEMEHWGVPLDCSDGSIERLTQVRLLYEPYLLGLSSRLKMDLPAWVPSGQMLDNWQTSAWEIKHF